MSLPDPPHPTGGLAVPFGGVRLYSCPGLRPLDVHGACAGFTSARSAVQLSGVRSTDVPSSRSAAQLSGLAVRLRPTAFPVFASVRLWSFAVQLSGCPADRRVVFVCAVPDRRVVFVCAVRRAGDVQADRRRCRLRLCCPKATCRQTVGAVFVCAVRRAGRPSVFARLYSCPTVRVTFARPLDIRAFVCRSACTAVRVTSGRPFGRTAVRDRPFGRTVVRVTVVAFGCPSVAPDRSSCPTYVSHRLYPTARSCAAFGCPSVASDQPTARSCAASDRSWLPVGCVRPCLRVVLLYSLRLVRVLPCSFLAVRLYSCTACTVCALRVFCRAAFSPFGCTACVSFMSASDPTSSRAAVRVRPPSCSCP